MNFCFDKNTMNSVKICTDFLKINFSKKKRFLQKPNKFLEKQTYQLSCPFSSWGEKTNEQIARTETGSVTFSLELIRVSKVNLKLSGKFAFIRRNCLAYIHAFVSNNRGSIIMYNLLYGLGAMYPSITNCTIHLCIIKYIKAQIVV